MHAIHMCTDVFWDKQADKYVNFLKKTVFSAWTENVQALEKNLHLNCLFTQTCSQKNGYEGKNTVGIHKWAVAERYVRDNV